jgi:hypothetical protein
MAASLQASSVARRRKAQVISDAEADTLPSLVRAGREFPIAPEPAALPSMIPEATLEYYAWLFRQRGFLSLGMTFEQFLAVATTVNPEISAFSDWEFDADR